MDWKGFFSVLAEAGYSGAMNIENEDEFYYPTYQGAEFHPAIQARFPRGARVPEDAGAAGRGLGRLARTRRKAVRADATPECAGKVA